MGKASDNVFPKLLTAMQTSAPAAPSDSSWKVYAKAGGIYARSSNAEVGPFGAASSGGTNLNPGTSFPVGPSTNDLCFRTDRGLLYYYDGTRWLTVNEYAVPGYVIDVLQPVLATTNSNYSATDQGANGAYVTRVVLTTTNIANDGSNYHTVQPKSRRPDGTTTNLGSSFTTASDTSGQPTKHVVTVGAVLGGTETQYLVTFTRTGSNSSIYTVATFFYRLIG